MRPAKSRKARPKCFQNLLSDGMVFCYGLRYSGRTVLCYEYFEHPNELRLLTMPTLNEIIAVLEQLAPLELAEEWDNVGLLVGDRKQTIERVMTCLTITPRSCDEAIAQKADLIVSHHPLPFHPMKKLTTDSNEGKLLLKLIAAGIAVYSAHTAYDSARAGINQHLALALQLNDIVPLVQIESAEPTLGTGRAGNLTGPHDFSEVIERLKASLQIESVRIVGNEQQSVTRVGIVCGSGGSLFETAQQSGCDCFVTGEATFHTCLAAEASGVALILLGHFTSERFAVELLAEYLSEQLPSVTVWASAEERTPIRSL